MNTTELIIRKNEKRNNIYFRDYSPITGDNFSYCCERIKVSLFSKDYYIPKQMAKDGLIQKIINTKKINNLDKHSVERIFFKIRLKYDFEFYAYTCIFIQDKKTKKPIRLYLNGGQRILLKELERQRINNLPIRIILVKARQWGGTTLIQAYMLWLQLHHYMYWHSSIISAIQEQSANIRNMVRKVINSLPNFHEKVSITSFEGTKNIKFIPQRGCLIQISSAETPDSLRSFDFSMIHMSEVGLWHNTPTKNGDDLAQAVYATVPDEPGTLIIMESTAKGVGTFFHIQYLEALNNKLNNIDGLKPVFVSWFNLKIYTKPIKDVNLFISQMTTYNWWQWEQGATLEGINWYNHYKKSKNYSDFQMKSEYPTTDNEAFQSKSGKYFSEEMLYKLKMSIREPQFIGDIRGASLVGSRALNDIHLISNASLLTEVLKIWIMPNDYIDTTKEKVTNRFLVTVDIGGLHYKSDNSVISVFDRLALTEPNGAMERAAHWIGHIDHDILAWKAVQIAQFYDNALLCIESNTIDSRDKKYDENYVASGDHTYTVLNEIEQAGYTNLYYRIAPPDTPGEKPTSKIGWNMNKKTKYLAYDAYNISIRENEYIEHSLEAYFEAEHLEINEKGAIAAMQGKRDDIQDTTATASYISNQFSSFPLPKIIQLNNNKKSYNKTGGIATI